MSTEGKSRTSRYNAIYSNSTIHSYIVANVAVGRDYNSAYMYARGRADALNARVEMYSVRDDANGQRVLCATVHPISQ